MTIQETKRHVRPEKALPAFVGSVCMYSYVCVCCVSVCLYHAPPDQKESPRDISLWVCSPFCPREECIQTYSIILLLHYPREHHRLYIIGVYGTDIS